MGQESPTSFVDWLMEEGPLLAPWAGGERSTYCRLALGIYSALPLPEHDFKPRPMSGPAPAAPCLCGSRARYADCCASFAEDSPFADMDLLGFVLDCADARDFARLPDCEVDPATIAGIARSWMEDGDYRFPVLLLEPWFKQRQTYSADLEPLLDALLDCYLEFDDTRKRERLIRDALAKGAPEVRAAALHRRVSMLFDAGRNAEAWRCFEEAQRVAPNHPALPMLELTLLYSRGDFARLRDRVDFWLARLKQQDDDEQANLIELLRAVRRDPRRALRDFDLSRPAALDTLEDMLATLPSPASHYTLAVTDDGLATLTPDAELKALIRRWRRNLPRAKAALTAVPGDEWTWVGPVPDWARVLQQAPLAWQSFEVLDDLVLVVDALHAMGAEWGVIDPLLHRATALLGLLAPATGAPRLPWRFEANRPALRLLTLRAHRALQDERRGVASDEFIEHAEWLLRLDPQDIHGLRDPLSRAYLARDWPDKVIALTDAYPDDFCAPTLNRVLALLVLGREQDAFELLTHIAKRHEVALKMLLATSAREPASDPPGLVRRGGKHEAWRYRQDMRDEWLRREALNWLRRAIKRVATSAPARAAARPKKRAT